MGIPHYEKAIEYLELLLEKNKVLNLTSITDIDQGILLHIEDSFVALDEVHAAPAGRLVDMGTGGGLPGVPLALATGRETVLVDSTKKKAQAVKEMIEKIGIEDVSVFDGRIEELARIEPNAFSVATARALASLPVLLELSAPLLKLGGRLVAYKADKVDQELEAACSIQDKVGMAYVETRDTILSDGNTKRSIVVFEKNAEPNVKLPRRDGAAQNHPYA